MLPISLKDDSCLLAFMRISNVRYCRAQGAVDALLALHVGSEMQPSVSLSLVILILLPHYPLPGKPLRVQRSLKIELV